MQLPLVAAQFSATAAAVTNAEPQVTHRQKGRRIREVAEWMAGISKELVNLSSERFDPSFCCQNIFDVHENPHVPLFFQSQRLPASSKPGSLALLCSGQRPAPEQETETLHTAI